MKSFRVVGISAVQYVIRLPIGGKITTKLLVAFKASKHDATLLFKNLELLKILFIQ